MRRHELAKHTLRISFGIVVLYLILFTDMDNNIIRLTFLPSLAALW